ncbi:MAG: tetratricopeptide repeat protein [Marinobacter sp.]|uniref:tetratricopeptide repeat protein n=1 Tax=Marinobacter sp. TaxID=50741 RepID=UPI001B2AD198|nr:hypothetical protein [Marinobacter sp.]
MTPERVLSGMLVVMLILAGCASQPRLEPEKAPAQPASLDPQAVVALNNRALSLKDEGEFREAARLLRSGVEASPDTPELHYNLAVIAELYLLDLETALAHYRRYRELTGDDDRQVAGWMADLERRLQ